MTFPHAVPACGVLDPSANERLKQSFGSWFWTSMIVATVLHFAAFAFSPELTAADFSIDADALMTIELPPEVKIPEPPQPIARPATPVMVAADLAEDLTIAPTTFEQNPVDALPPPPDNARGDFSTAPSFTPFTVAPEIVNMAAVVRAMQREYPAVLRDSGIGGTVRVNFFIGEEGEVRETRVDESSGYQALDAAALAVADVVRFSPALNRDTRVAVWVVFPIVFRVDDREE
jgi:protein TonB